MQQKSILAVSNTDDAHVTEVCRRLEERSVPTFRLDSDVFASQRRSWRICASTDEPMCTSWFVPEISTVWYRKVVLPEGTSVSQAFVREETEGLFNSILALYQNCRWVNRRESIAAARTKIAQLQRAKELGLRIPDTLVTTSLEALEEFAAQHHEQIVAKPIQAQVIGAKDDALVIGTRKLPREFFESALAFSPCYAQEQLIIKSEIRVVVFGTDLYSFRLTARAKADDLKQLKLSQIEHERHELDGSVAAKVRTLMSFYGLEFGAIDFAIIDDSEPVFLELNPNGQWLWLQYMTGVNLIDPFIDLLCL